VGHSIRRVLLSSIQGAAVTNVRIKGVMHEFTTLPGVWEDITHILLKPEGSAFQVTAAEPQTVTISAKGEGNGDFGRHPLQPERGGRDPNVHIATLGEEGELEIEMWSVWDRGFITADRNQARLLAWGFIPMDSNHSPIIG